MRVSLFIIYRGWFLKIVFLYFRVILRSVALKLGRSAFYFPRENQNLAREKTSKNCPWKYKVARETLKKSNFCPWKHKVARETRKKSNFYPWKTIFCPWKNSKNGKKMPVKNKNCPWKNWKKGQKWLSRATFFFTGKKKNAATSDKPKLAVKVSLNLRQA